MATIYRRDNYGNYYDNSRYAFVAFVVAAILLFTAVTCFVNYKRLKRGRSPILSSYLAPPSYRQSQVAYEGQVTTTLPKYTADANPTQDAGYYDVNGNFVPAETPVMKSTNAYELHEYTLEDNTELPIAHTQIPGPNDAHNLNDMIYQRPPHPPPNLVSPNDNLLPTYSATGNNPFTPENTGTNHNHNT